MQETTISQDRTEAKDKASTRARLTRLERETIVNWNEAEAEAFISSCSKTEWHRLSKLGIEPYKQTEDCRWYRIPKSWVRIKPVKPKTHAQLGALAKARQAKKSIVATEGLPEDVYDALPQ